MKSIQILDKSIGKNYPPFIIAELSGNHGQSIDKALAMIDAAANAGAHAIKIQTYTPKTMTLDINTDEFFIDDPKSIWTGKSLYQLYQIAMTPWEWHQELFEYSEKKGLIAFSSPFDKTAVDFLETLNVPCYKIASFENTDHSLLQKVAVTGKPVIMSTGMATLSELTESVEVLRDFGCAELILLKCTSHYPARPVDANLRTIPHLAEMFDCQVGLSDHTTGIGVALASVAIGATVVEKHFVLDRKDGGVDAEFSLEPKELQQLVQESERAFYALGNVHYGANHNEKAARKHRRSLYVCEDMIKGDIFTDINLRSIRPGNGLPPKYLDFVLGRPVRKDIKKGTALDWDCF